MLIRSNYRQIDEMKSCPSEGLRWLGERVYLSKILFK